jgi:hypothetical protein
MDKVKNILVIIVIILISGFFFNCSRKQMTEKEKIISKIKTPEGVREDFFKDFMNLYLERWGNYEVEHSMAKKVLNEYFGDSKYRIIWKWDTDGDDKIDYLGVEEYPGIVKGIKRGILVSEDGEIKMYIDRDKGFYTPREKVFDFERIGFRKGEVECIRLLFINDEMKFNKNQLENYRKAAKEPSEVSIEIGVFCFQALDKDLKVITHWSDKNASYVEGFYIRKLLWQKDWKVYYLIYGYDEDDVFQLEKELLLSYRENKSKGLVYDPVNFNPDKLYEELSNRKWYEFWKMWQPISVPLP